MGIIQDVRSKHPEYDDMSDDALADALHSKFYADMPKEQFREKVGLPASGRQIGWLEAFGRGALQGLTFNTSDEIYAGGRAALGDDYDTALKEVRGANALAAEQNPGTTLAGEVAGGVVPAIGTAAATMLFPGAAPAAAATNAKTAAQAVSLAGRAWQGVKVGAPLGAAYSAGAYEGAPEESLTDSALGRLGAAGKGAAFGAATGAVLTPVVDVGAGLVRAGANQVRALAQPEKFAQRKYGEALARDSAFRSNGANERELREQLNDLAKGSPNAIVGDAGGDATKTLIRTALNRPNAENDAFLRQLNNRQGQQWQEIEQNLSTRLGNPDDFGRVSEAVSASRSKDADAAYGAAYKADFNPSKELFDLFKTDEDGKFIRPTIGKLVNTVRTRLQDIHGDDAANLVDQNGLGFVHQIKVEIDHMIGQARKATNRGDATSSDKYDLATLVDLKKQIISGLEQSQGQAPKLYLNANKQFSNSKALSNALEQGRKESQATEDVIRASLADMTPVEQQHYKLGLARGLADKNRVGNKMNDRIGRDWRDPQDEFRIDAMMGNDADGFRGALEAMEKARDLRRAATGNSHTAKFLNANADAKQEAEKVLGAVSAVKNAASGNWGALLNQARNAMKARIEGINPRVAEEILRIASRPARGIAKSQYIDKMVEQGKQLAAAQNLSSIQRDRLILALIRAADATMSGASYSASAPK